MVTKLKEIVVLVLYLVTTTTVDALSFFSKNNNKRIPQIDQWELLKDGTLTGIVKGHPALDDFEEITTSPLSNPDSASEGKGTIVTTLSGSQYKLEIPKKKRKTRLIPRPPLHKMVPIKKQTRPGRRQGGIPSIDDWEIDLTTGRLIGIVFRHNKLPDGDFISASAPLENNLKQGMVITTENGSRYKLETARKISLFGKDKDSRKFSDIRIDPQPPSTTTSENQHLINDKMTELGKLETGWDFNAAAVGVVEVLGLNVVNDPSDIIIADFNPDSSNSKEMVENDNEGVPLSSSSSSSSSASKQLEEQSSTATFGKLSLSSSSLTAMVTTSVDKDTVKFEREQKQKQQEKNRQTNRVATEEEAAVAASDKENLERHMQILIEQEEENARDAEAVKRKQEELELQKKQEVLDRHIRLQGEETARRVIAKEKFEREEQHRFQHHKQQQQQQLSFHLEAPETAKKLDRQAVIKEKIKVEEKQKMRQRNIGRSLQIDKITSTFKEFQISAKEIEQSWIVDEQPSVLVQIQEKISGLATSGIAVGTALVASFEIQPRVRKSEILNLNDDPIDAAAFIPALLPPAMTMFATKIKDKAKFVDEIDDLLREMEDVLSEVDDNLKNVSIFPSESKPIYFADDVETTSEDPQKKEPIGATYSATRTLIEYQEIMRTEENEIAKKGWKRKEQLERMQSKTEVKVEEEIRRLEVEEKEKADAVAKDTTEEERIRTHTESKSKGEEERKRIEAKAKVKIEEERKRLEAEAEAKSDEERKRIDAEAKAKSEQEWKRKRVKAEVKEEEERKQTETKAKVQDEDNYGHGKDLDKLLREIFENERIEQKRYEHMEKEKAEGEVEEVRKRMAVQSRKEETSIERVRRNLIGTRLLEQKKAYQLLLEERATSDRIHFEAKVLKKVEAEAKLEGFRRNLLGKRMKEQKFAYELLLEERTTSDRIRMEAEALKEVEAEAKLEICRRHLLGTRLLEQKNTYQLLLEERVTSNKSRMEEKLEICRRNLLGARLLEQKNAYQVLLEERVTSNKIRMEAEALIEVEAEAQIERCRRNLLDKRIKEQNNAYQLLLQERAVAAVKKHERETIEEQKAHEISKENERRRMLACRLSIQKRLAKSEETERIALEKTRFELLLEKNRRGLLKKRLKQQKFLFEVEVETKKLKWNIQSEVSRRQMLSTRLVIQKQLAAKSKTEAIAAAKAEIEAKKKVEELAAKKKTEEEAVTRVKIEELAAQKKAKTKAKKKAEEEAATRTKAKEELAAKKNIENEAKKKTEEEAANRAKIEEVLAARQIAEEETATKAKAEEELIAKKKAESKAKKEAGVEAATRAKVEEELAAKKKADEAAAIAEAELQASQEDKSVSTQSPRMTELERLELEFGMKEIDVDIESHAQTEHKSESVEKEQLEVSSRLEELQHLEDICRVTEQQMQQNKEVYISKEQNHLDKANEEAEKITESDLSYQPSHKVLASIPLLMNEIAGPSLDKYDSKEAYFTGRDVGIHAETTLSIPIRVSNPGTIVEFTIEKKSYDFGFGITAFLDDSQVVKVKEMSPFLKRSNTDKILIPAGSAPCTMQFKFENKHSTLLEKVFLSYEIKVTPPSVETIRLGRRRRAKATLDLLDSKLISHREILEISSAKVMELEREAIDLQTQMNEKIARFKHLKILGVREQQQTKSNKN